MRMLFHVCVRAETCLCDACASGRGCCVMLVFFVTEDDRSDVHTCLATHGSELLDAMWRFVERRSLPSASDASAAELKALEAVRLNSTAIGLHVLNMFTDEMGIVPLLSERTAYTILLDEVNNPSNPSSILSTVLSCLANASRCLSGAQVCSAVF